MANILIDKYMTNFTPIELFTWPASQLCKNHHFLSVFDGLAIFLNQKLESSGVEPKVIVANNSNLKFVEGEHFL